MTVNQKEKEEIEDPISISQEVVSKLQCIGIMVSNVGIVHPGQKGVYYVSWRNLLNH